MSTIKSVQGKKKIGAEKMQNTENIEVLRRAEAKLVTSKLVSARLWERVPGKERLYLEPKSQEAIKKAAGYCSKADFMSMKNAYVDTNFEFNGLEEKYDAQVVVKMEVQAALDEAASELEAEAAAADSTSTADDHGEKKDEKPDVFLASELENEVVRSEAVVNNLPEGEPLSQDQLAYVVEERCVGALSFEAEAGSLPAALKAAMLEPGEQAVSLEALAEGLKAAEEATSELRSGSLAAASQLYSEAQHQLECAGLLGSFAWAPAFAGELSRWAAMAAEPTTCEGKAEELPELPLYEPERQLLESGEPLCLREGMLEALED